MNCGRPECDFVLQQQLTSYQTEKNRLSLTLEERTEQERAEQSKTLERLEQELVIREKAEAAAAEAERERSVLAVDLKDLQQKLERLKQEYNALQDKVRFVGKEQNRCTALALVVQRVDSAIHWINNHCQVGSVVCSVDTYPLDSELTGG